MNAWIVALVVMMALATANPVSAIRCYSCLSLTRSACNGSDTSNWSTVNNCRSCVGAEMSLGRIFGRVRGCNEYKSCAQSDEDTTTKELFPGLVFSKDYSCCETDLCNSAPTLSALPWNGSFLAAILGIHATLLWLIK